jgi:hypothetical protein
MRIKYCKEVCCKKNTHWYENVFLEKSLKIILLATSTTNETLFFTNIYKNSSYYRMFNLKVDLQLSYEYLTSDAIYNGSDGMPLYYYMCRSWQDFCRRGENRSWPSVSVESVDSECWCLNKDIFYAFIMLLAVKKGLFILESYLTLILLRWRKW